ncbi:MAG: FAD-binding oxidoreductase [Aestuariivita sp.]|nr:FAD-binding oxidoreductase [Aestuariivita sp.]
MTLMSSIFEEKLRSNLSPSCFPTSSEKYFHDPRGQLGFLGLVIAPEKVDEVSFILSNCNQERVPVVPYGGGTGLVKGQLFSGMNRPVIISLERMKKIRGVYPNENTLVAEAGAILSDVKAAARKVDRLFPLSIAAEGSARIGGNLATNAGGTNVLRYGNTRDLCLGLEVVFPDGRILSDLSRLRKNNTGYDIKNLLIGSEGTLGIITAATLKLAPQPAKEGTAFFVIPSPKEALSLLSLARTYLGENISTFELIHRQGLEFLQEKIPDVRIPFAELPEWVVLIDIGVPRHFDPIAILIDLYEEGQNTQIVSNGWIAQSQRERDQFWSVREHIPEANRKIGAISTHDISVPITMIPEFVSSANKEMVKLGDFRVNCFGHIGDGNLHYDIFPAHGKTREYYQDIEACIQKVVYDLVTDMEGSISAEHGIGRLKVKELECYCDSTKLAVMKQIKQTVDPNGIMNPGAVISCETC